MMAGIGQDHGNKKLIVLQNLNERPFLSLMNVNISQTFVGALIRLDNGGVQIYIYIYRMSLWTEYLGL